MEMKQPLNYSSPIVQRVLRVRERVAWPDIGDQSGTRYQWQMWQKSDFSAYAEDGSEHRCKNTPPSSGQGANEGEQQRVPAHSQAVSAGDMLG